jgi:hypothetical protein
MRVRGPLAAQILELPRLPTPDERRAVFRQTMAALAQAPASGVGGLLDAVNPEGLRAAVRTALDGGLVDDLDWLAPPAAGAALYELAAALPPSAEQREVGRRALARTLEGDAETFAGIATRMALGTGKGLQSGPIRARIGLLVELPVSADVPDGPLALALVSRRPLARELVAAASTGSLASRRLAARLLERAARETAGRAQQGDDHSVRAFAADGVAQAFERLLSDRESLVWRHVAVARGLLAPWMPQFKRALAEHLSPKLTPTEWRRAATSIAAMIAVDPDSARKSIATMLVQIAPKDRGVAGALVWGLARAAEVEPDAAGEVLEQIVDSYPADVAEAAAELGLEWGTGVAFESAVASLLARLAARDVPVDATDEGGTVLQRELVRDLERLPRKNAAPEPNDDGVRAHVARALGLWATAGARAAYAAAKEALSAAENAVAALRAVGEESDDAKGAGIATRTELVVLRDLDLGLLERATLLDLLRLGPSADVVRAHEEALFALQKSIAEFVMEHERRAGDSPRHGALRLRRLRALLHLVDGEIDGEAGRTGELAGRNRSVAVELLRRSGALPPALRRASSAALARSLDALVRAQVLDAADALLVVARTLAEPAELRVLAEAAMDPELRHAFGRCAAFASAIREQDEARSSLAPGVIRPSAFLDRVEPKLRAFEAWTKDLFLDPSSRAESLRTVLARIAAALRAIAGAEALSSLGEAGEQLDALEQALDALAALAAGAEARLDSASEPPPGPLPSSLAVFVSRVLSGAEPVLDALGFTNAIEDAVAGTPRVLIDLVREVLASVPTLPRRTARSGGSIGPERGRAELPAWLPPRRTLGGFYVVRGLGSGGGGSVFIATRVEERTDPQAERFALKVPDFTIGAARTLSETEFLQMFRAEASALIGLPAHPNIARFVTFDTASRPKPILVMELVEGPTFEASITTRALTTQRVFEILDDVLAGLEAMHGVEVGHLDVKPSNVVLRNGGVGVLVDFGLAGRHVRPSCASGSYGAPEVWSPPAGVTLDPRPVDVYAFGCLAFEALTGRTLIDGPNELALIARHLAHDGFPEPLKALASNELLAPLAEVLFSALRRDPQKRPTVRALRGDVRRLGASLAKAPWPLA